MSLAGFDFCRMLQGSVGRRLCAAVPGGQCIQAVHSLLLGCSAAVQAARLGIHPGSSAGTDRPQMSQRLAQHCLRQVLGCVSICAAFHSRTSLSQPDIVIAMHTYNWVSQCTHAEVNTSRVSSHENRGVSANLSPLKGRQCIGLPCKAW